MEDRTGVTHESLDGHDFYDLRNFLHDHPLDTSLQRHLAHGTTMAGAGQTYFDDFSLYTHQFNISTVTLQHRPDFIQSFFHFLAHLVYSSYQKV